VNAKYSEDTEDKGQESHDVTESRHGVHQGQNQVFHPGHGVDRPQRPENSEHTEDLQTGSVSRGNEVNYTHDHHEEIKPIPLTS
jgi:hypothetical protein